MVALSAASAGVNCARDTQGLNQDAEVADQAQIGSG